MCRFEYAITLGTLARIRFSIIFKTTILMRDRAAKEKIHAIELRVFPENGWIHTTALRVS